MNRWEKSTGILLIVGSGNDNSARYADEASSGEQPYWPLFCLTAITGSIQRRDYGADSVTLLATVLPLDYDLRIRQGKSPTLPGS